MAEVFTRRINIYIDSGQAQVAYDKLTAQQARLTAEVKKYADAGKEAPAKIRQQLDDVTAAVDRQHKKLTGQLSPSLKDLTATYNRLNREVAVGSKQDAGFAEKERQAKAAKVALDQYRSSLSNLRQGFSSLLSQAKGVAFGVLIGNTVQAGVAKIQEYISGIIGGAAKLSDELADIQKTTGLTTDEVTQLNAELGKIDTRTSKSDLRGLAVEAGKLGIEGVDGIRKFVEEANQIRVALGEDLGEDAIIKISKVAGIFKEGALNIASGINDIGQSSAASEGYQTDFLFRMAGISQTAKLAAGDILGFGAALDINGQEVEKSSTALQTFFIDFVKNTESFGKAAGMADGALSKLLNEKGTSAAFIEFLKGLKAANPEAEQMLKALEKLGIDGARGASTFLTLANNIGLVEEQQRIANSAIQKGSSITDEYSKRNNNLAANLEKLSKHFSSLIERINLNTFAKNMVDFFIKPTEDATVALEKEARQLEINLIALQDVNLTGEARKKLIEETNAQYGKYLPQLITEKTTMQELKQIQIESNKQILLKIAAMRYQKELNQILEDEIQARESISQLQINMSKSGQVGADLGLTPSQIQQQQQMIKGTQQVFEGVVKNTGNRIDNLKEKYKNVALDLSSTFDDILKKLETTGTSAPGAPGVPKGAADPTEEDKKKAKELAEFIKKLREELSVDLFDKNAKEIALVRLKYQKMREQANGNREALRLIAQLEANELQQILDRQATSYEGFQKSKLELTKITHTQLSDILLTDQELTEQWKEKWKKAIKEVYDEFQTIANVFQSAHDFLSVVFQGIDQNERQELAKDKRYNDEKKKNLKSQLDGKRISQRQYNKEVERLDDELDEKKKELALKAFKREKALKITQVAINTATSVMNMLATAPWPVNIVMAALAAATGIAQGIIIGKSDPPEYGEGDEAWRKGIGGKKHSHRSRGNPVLDPDTGETIARLEQGEAIIPADSTAANPGVITALIRAKGRSIADQYPFERKALNVSRSMENVMFERGGVFDRAIGDKQVRHVSGLQPIPSILPGENSELLAQLMKEQNKLLIEEFRKAQDKKVIFVKQDYDDFNNQINTTFKKRIS